MKRDSGEQSLLIVLLDFRNRGDWMVFRAEKPRVESGGGAGLRTANEERRFMTQGRDRDDVHIKKG